MARINAIGNNNNYTYHALQAEPVAYYRLKMVDNAGYPTMSTVVTLSQEEMASYDISVYPVPAKDFIYIKLANSGQLDVYNIEGQRIKIFALQKGIHKIDISNLKPGTYVGRINNATLTFIKNKYNYTYPIVLFTSRNNRFYLLFDLTILKSWTGFKIIITHLPILIVADLM